MQMRLFPSVWQSLWLALVLWGIGPYLGAAETVSKTSKVELPPVEVPAAVVEMEMDEFGEEEPEAFLPLPDDIPGIDAVEAAADPKVEEEKLDTEKEAAAAGEDAAVDAGKETAVVGNSEAEQPSVPEARKKPRRRSHWRAQAWRGKGAAREWTATRRARSRKTGTSPAGKDEGLGEAAEPTAGPRLAQGSIKEAREHVEVLRTSSDYRRQVESKDRLIAMGPGVIPLVAPLLDEPYQTGRIFAIVIMRETGGKEAYPNLFHLLADNDPKVRLHTGLALTKMTGQVMDYHYADTPEARQRSIVRWRAYLTDKNLLPVPKSRESEKTATADKPTGKEKVQEPKVEQKKSGKESLLSWLRKANPLTALRKRDRGEKTPGYQERRPSSYRAERSRRRVLESLGANSD